MSKNLRKDESKERYKLTIDYKKIKEETYDYKPHSAKALYLSFCSKCHNENGLGTMMAPALVDSPVIVDSTKTQLLLKIIIQGMQGKMVRNHREYNSIMPGFKNLAHKDLSHITNYIRFELNNIKGNPVHPVEVIKTKVETLTTKSPLNAEEIL